MGKQIFVTGATGRIGSLLCRELCKKGHEVRAFVLPGDPFVSRLSETSCEIVYGNLLDQEAIEKALQGCEIVLHMAAYMNPAKDMDENLYMKINVAGTWYLTRSAMRAGVRRMVYGSSDAIYPPHCQTRNPIEEEDPKRPHFLYPLTKNLNESIVFEAWRESGYQFEVTATRFGSVMMQDEILTSLCARGVYAALRGSATCPATSLYRADVPRPWEAMEAQNIPEDALCIPYGPDGRAWRMHYTHVSDVVQGIILAMESDAAPGEAFNILGPSSTPKDVAVKYLAEKTGQPYYEAHLQTYWDFECSIEKARRLLGYAPVYDTKKMIDDALAWRAKGVFTQHTLNSATFEGDH